MDEPAANQFITFLVKSLQALCNGCIEFSSSVEVIGHIHLNIDHKVKLNYVLTEEVSKSASEDATLFSSHSYHSKPPQSQDSTDTVDRAPSPPRGSSSTNTNSRCKTHQLPRVDDSEGFSFTTFPQPISVVPAETDSTASEQVVEREDTSHIPKDAGRTTDHDSPQAVASSASGSQDRRRKSLECAFQTSATKHRRMNEASVKLEPPSPEEIILHVKGEADSGDEAVTVELSGQDITSPDDSHVMVMVPVQDHASQTKTSSLGTGKTARKRQSGKMTSVPGGKCVCDQKAGDSGQQSQHQPYPVMLHSMLGSSEMTVAELGSSSSTQPGPSTISGLAMENDELRVSHRLFQKRKRDSQECAAPAPHENEEDVSRSAKRQRRYRQRVKADPEKYKEFRGKERERMKKYKQNLTPEQKAHQRELSKQRVRKCREKKKEQNPKTRASSKLDWKKKLDIVSGMSKCLRCGRQYSPVQLGTRGKPGLSSPPGEGLSAEHRLSTYQRKILAHAQAGTLRQFTEERVRYGKKYRHAMSAEKKQLFNAKQAVRQQQYRQRLKEKKQASMGGISAEQTEKEERIVSKQREEEEQKVSKHALYMRQWRKARALKKSPLKCEWV